MNLIKNRRARRDNRLSITGSQAWLIPRMLVVFLVVSTNTLVWSAEGTTARGVVRPGGTADKDPSGAVSFLRFASEPDGKCHNLSEGGQLIKITNEHAGRRIRLRLHRLFAGVRQGGLVVLDLSGRESASLGCSLVDGHGQSWEVERAAFSD